MLIQQLPGLMKYKFSLLNLALVNQAYPLDFFLRIKTDNIEKFQDSPIIQSNSMQCEQAFPWQFLVSSNKLIVQFIQISNNSQVQIVRAQAAVNKLTSHSQTVSILAKRTAKKLCLINYKFQQYTDSDNSPETKQNRVKNHFDESWNQEGSQNQQQQKQKGNGLLFSKQEKLQLSKQISNLNKSIDKILSHEKNQHAMFNRFLNQSTSFIRQMMNKSKQQPRINDSTNDPIQQQHYPISYLKQYEEDKKQGKKSNQITSKVWYQKKYHKTRPDIITNKNFRKQLNNQVNPIAKETSLQYFQPQIENLDQSLIFSELSFNTATMPSEVIFSEYQNQKPIVQLISQKEGYDWNKPTKLPQREVFVITAKIGNSKQLKGCIARKQFQQEKVILYDINGQQKGSVKFKFRKLKIYGVQTQEILQMPTSQIKSQKYKQNQEEQQQNNRKDDKKKLMKSQRQNEDVSKPYKRSARIRKSTQERKNDNKHSQKLQMENKQDGTSPNTKSNRCDLSKNIGQPNLISFLKKRKNLQKQQPKSALYIKDDVDDGFTPHNLPFIKQTNIKIDTISVKLSKNINEFVGRFIRLNMKNKSPYITQTISLSQNLVWKGKGFLFDNISPYSELKIQLCSNEKNNQIIQGTSKVCLALLNMQKNNVVQFYHDYLRDQNQNTIGQLILGYESIDKIKRASSTKSNRDGFDQRKQNNEDIQQQKPKVKRKKRRQFKQKSKEIKKDSQASDQNVKKQKIGLYGSQPKSIVGSASIIRAKKYTGGNIIIGRAPRFKTYSDVQPGPAEYKIGSSYDDQV